MGRPVRGVSAAGLSEGRDSIRGVTHFGSLPPGWAERVEALAERYKALAAGGAAEGDADDQSDEEEDLSGEHDDDV